MIEDATRAIDLNGSLAAAWKQMAAKGVKRIKAVDIAAGCANWVAHAKPTLLAFEDPHLQCAFRLASRNRCAGSPHAARKPRSAPSPLPQAGEGAMHGPVDE